MTRKKRLWLILLAVPVGLVLAGIVVLKIMFTEERLKEMVIPRAEEAIGRPVAIEGISLGIFPALVLDINGVEVANRQGEGFSPSPFLSLESLRLSVKLFPLLAGRFEVTSLEMDTPRLLLEVNRQNQTNYADLGGGPPDRKAPSPVAGEPAPGETPEPAEPEAVSPAAALLVSSLRIINGAVDYVDHREDAATRIRGITLTTSLIARGDTVFLAGDGSGDSLSYGTVSTPLFDGIRVGLAHRILYTITEDRLVFDHGDLTVQDMRLDLGGTITTLRGSTVLDLTIGSDSINIADLFSLIPKEYMKKAEGLEGTGIARVHISVTGVLTDSTNAEFRGSIAARGASLRYSGLPKPISNITIQSTFTRTRANQEFRVDEFTASLGDTPVRATLQVRNFENPSLSLTAAGSLDLSTVREYYPLEKGTELSGRMKADIRLTGRVSDPAAMRAGGTLDFNGVSAKTAGSPNPVKNLNGTVTFTNQVLESQGLSLGIGKSDMRLRFRALNYLSLLTSEENAPSARADMTLQSNRLYVSDILSEPAAAGTPPPRTEGAPKPPSRSKTPPAQPGTAPQNGGLPLPNVEMDIEAGIGTLTTEKFVFKNVRGKIKILNGVITMQNLNLEAFGGSVSSRGTLNMQSPERPVFDLSLDLTALQANALLPHFTSFGQRLSGKLTMNTSLKGALDDTLGLVPSALDGDGRVIIREGTLKGFRVNQALASSLNLPDLETVAFRDWTNVFAVRQGRFVVNNLRISALSAEYVVNGSQGLDGTLDYSMTVFLPPTVASRLTIPGFAGEAVNLFKDESGRLKLDFNVGGTTDTPKLQLDTAPARMRAEELARQKLQEEKKKLEESLKEKAGDALKKLLKPK